MTKIGPYHLSSRAVLAPMAGITDQPFRTLCLKFGAGAATTEMTSSNPALWGTRKSALRRAHGSLPKPHIVQILGTEPEQMAAAAQFNVELGAEIIDINMGCPAKKVCNKLAGSALMKNEALVTDILTAVVKAVQVPVTLKMRTGWSIEQKNAVNIAKIAENCGIKSLAVHGRTRACRYNGVAEYDTIAEVVSAVSIPVFANGDIRSAENVKSVLNYTRAAGVMIGRAAQGKPWIFKQINDLLNNKNSVYSASLTLISATMREHVQELHAFYGEPKGVKIARKHVAWYLQNLQQCTKSWQKNFNQLESTDAQLNEIEHFFGKLSDTGEIAA